MNSLNRKVLRDAWRLRGPLAASAAVVAAGVALFVALRSMNGYLLDAQARYYAQARFAGVFVRVARAPESLEGRMAALPGVASVRARIVKDVTLDVPGLKEPATGRLVSVPVPRRPILNDLVVRRGSWPEAPADVLVSEAFARANALSPGDTLGAVVAGRWRRLRVAGIAVSPEFIYEIRGGGEVFPDNRRFGVVWMGEGALAAATGMQGAFNDAALTLSPGASEPGVLAALDRLLEPYGGEGAYGREDHVSHRFVADEIAETAVTSVLIPGIFLAVTALLLHMVLSRLVGMQRGQVAVLRAFGYTRAAVGMHYLALAVLPALAGAVPGTALGVWLAGQVAAIYSRFYQFPASGYQQDWRVVAAAVAIGSGAALLGAGGAAWRAASLPPAEAMRPESPVRFRPGLVERLRLAALVPPATRMIVRNLERRPARAAMTVTGIALAVALVVASRFIFDALDFLRDAQFYHVMREDVTVIFDAPRPGRAVHEVARLPGVLRTEGFRTVPVRLRRGHRVERAAVLGMPAGGELHRIVGSDLRARRPPPGGLLLTAKLAEMLGAALGDTLEVEVLEGARPVRRAAVSGTVDEVIGTAAYMEIGALHRLLREGPTLSGAWLRTGSPRADRAYTRLKRMPAVSVVSVRRASLQGFRRTIDESFRISVYVLIAFACVLAVGVVYNGARVALSERGHELASLRVLGFTRGEVAAMLLGEQAALTVAALPLGFAAGRLLCLLITLRFSSELFRIPLVVRRSTYLFAAVVVIAAAAASAALVRLRIDRLDLVESLKARE
ncbi:MAG TPA: FtsX-like permease family protein [Longimicrobium sp.]|nr:FtsX-like permease family protein [Longimicrobium sp.]